MPKNVVQGEKVAVYTADGMLTRASTYVPAGNRARMICVHVSNTSEEKKITISITPNTILSFSTPSKMIVEGQGNGLVQVHKMHGKNRGLKWHGWAWLVTNTQQWTNTPFVLEEEYAPSSLSVEQAIVEHLRYILNKQLHIRPLVSDRVCVEVTEALKTKAEASSTKITFHGVRQKVSENGYA